MAANPQRTGLNTTQSVNRPAALFQIQHLLNTINHVFIFLVAVYITVLARSLKFQDTAMHMFLTGIGFHFLCAEALMSHYPANPITRRFTHRTKSKFHGILQILGGSIVLLGSLGKIYNKEVHFSTIHGTVGICAAFMCFASILGGTVNYFKPNFVTRYLPPSELKFRHNLFGLITFSLGILAILLGYRTKFFFKYVDAEFINILSVTTIMIYILTMIGPVKSLIDKKRYRR